MSTNTSTGIRTNARESMLKTVLWGIVGVFAVVTVARFSHGLGATTALSDATPWGFWIAFDVMSGVALAAGGFVMAAVVYIFGRQKYRMFARPAILTALLGYVAVAVGLLYDLGLPWRIWHAPFYPQPRSALFEVAMCVILYLTVLFLEFSPVVLEHPLFDRPLFRAAYRVLKKAAIPLVITGIVLSTLHQSSLGSLFLIAPYRLHPLWYSPYIWILFFISAVGLGLMMVTLESLFSAWLFGHKLPREQLAGLGRATSVVLFVYLAARVGDLAARGVLGTAVDDSWQSMLFLFELAVSAIIPATLLAIRRVRESEYGLGACATMTVLGMIGYRFDVCVVAFARPEGMSYFPSWMEIVVSLGIVASAMLVFIFFVKNLKVYPEEKGHEEVSAAPVELSPFSLRPLLPASLSAPRRYSLAAMAAAALAIAMLPGDALFGAQPEATPVSEPRAVEGLLKKSATRAGHELTLVDSSERPPVNARRVTLLAIDGNRDGRAVLFHHDGHIKKLGDRRSCNGCHHQRLPFRRNTPCRSCHRDMYSSTDIFSHSSHVAKLGGNRGCGRCHRDLDRVKTRQSATPCRECHREMMVSGSMVKPLPGGLEGRAAGYMDAMHGLCIKCHEQGAKQDPALRPLAACAGCHRGVDTTDLRAKAPYIARRGDR